MPALQRFAPAEVWPLLQGHGALLVCAYEEDENFRTMSLSGAISWHEFLARKPWLSRTQPVIFYCACPREASAVGRAQQLQNEGFAAVGVLDGGVSAWQAAGLPLSTR